MTLEFLSQKERVSLDLQDMYSKFGFVKYKINRFEEYSFYMEKEQFLNDNRILTFSDSHGKLMALKPDVTMSIVKNSLKSQEKHHKIYYNESVFRIPKGEDDFKEIHQIGVEYIGPAKEYQTLEILNLAVKSLEKTSEDYRICLSNTALLLCLLKESKLEQKETIIQYMRQKNSHDLAKYLSEEKIPQGDIFLRLLTLPSDLEEGLATLKILSNDTEFQKTLEEFRQILEMFQQFVPKEKVYLDFSHIPSTEYYDGLVFSGYIQGLSLPVLVGGRYDNLIEKMGVSGQSALGFAVDLSAVDKLFGGETQTVTEILEKKGESVVDLMEKANMLYQEGKTFQIMT
ncbi:MAG: ATP phosphoribosyltransferase regulatory subunit [Eubacteriales bacterium]